MKTLSHFQQIFLRLGHFNSKKKKKSFSRHIVSSEDSLTWPFIFDNEVPSSYG